MLLLKTYALCTLSLAALSGRLDVQCLARKSLIMDVSSGHSKLFMLSSLLIQINLCILKVLRPAF